MKPSHALLLFALLGVVLLTTSNLAAQVEPASQSEEIGPTVKLLDAGQGAKKTLRLQVEKGLKQTMVMTMKMEQTIEMGGNKVPSPAIPGQKMTMDMEVTDVDAAGDIHYTFTISKIDLVEGTDGPSPMAGMLKTMLKPLEGSAGKAVITSRGINKSTDFKLAEGVSPQLRQMMDSMSQQSFQQMSSPFPVEPVGLGAKWEVTQNIAANGMKIKQISTQEIVGIAGNVLKTKITLKQEAGAQDVKMPGMPAAVGVRLLSLSSKGEGEATIDVTKLVPQASKLITTSDLKMEIDAAGQKQTMAMTMKADVQVTSGKPTE